MWVPHPRPGLFEVRRPADGVGRDRCHARPVGQSASTTVGGLAGPRPVSKDTTARLWDAATGREVAGYAWDVGPLNAVAFAADGMRAAVSGKKGTILVWDVD